MDKKSNYVGDHGGKYVGTDGVTRQFTYVDHDIKPSLHISPTKEEINEAKSQLKTYRQNLISRILSTPPSRCPQIFWDFTVRGDISKIEWNTTMLYDEGLPIERLRDMCNMVENINGIS